MPIPHWTLHDLRRTARSLLSRKGLGIDRDIRERVLGHTIRGVEGTYDRHDYDRERAEALQALANEIERIIRPPGDNVIELAAAREAVS